MTHGKGRTILALAVGVLAGGLLAGHFRPARDAGLPPAAPAPAAGRAFAEGIADSRRNAIVRAVGSSGSWSSS